MERKKYPPPDDESELTRQLEMLMQGLSVADEPQLADAGNQERPKRRSLDDMRRLSEHIKGVPVYKRK